MLLGLILLMGPGGCLGDFGPRPARPGGMRLVPVNYDALPGWTRGAQHEAIVPLWRSCARVTRQAAASARIRHTVRAAGGSVDDWRRACAALTAEAPVGAAAARAFFERHFMPFLVVGADGAEGRFTGYYEIELRGARQRDGEFRFAVYAAPPGLRDAGTPFYSRRAIETGGVAAQWPVLFYAADPVDVFFLHIQGSGLVRLAEGGTMRVGYADDNGHPFVAIGRLMLERGLIPRERPTAEAVRDWLRRHPERGAELMRENPRYIFFREIEGPGPVGAEGVPLTAGRSLAVDPAFIPYGAPLWLDTTMPGAGRPPLRRLVIAQDRGAAINGAVRGDLFWGTGETAFERASPMNQRGRYFILLPRADRRTVQRVPLPFAAPRTILGPATQ